MSPHKGPLQPKTSNDEHRILIYKFYFTFLRTKDVNGKEPLLTLQLPLLTPLVD